MENPLWIIKILHRRSISHKLVSVIYYFIATIMLNLPNAIGGDFEYYNRPTPSIINIESMSLGVDVLNIFLPLDDLESFNTFGVTPAAKYSMPLDPTHIRKKRLIP